MSEAWCWYRSEWERYRVVETTDRSVVIDEAVTYFIEYETPIESISDVKICQCKRADPMNHIDKFEWFRDRFEEDVYDNSGCDSTDDVIVFSDGAQEAYEHMMKEFVRKYVSVNWWSCDGFSEEDVTEEVRALVAQRRSCS